jgi:hypothetical protein
MRKPIGMVLVALLAAFSLVGLAESANAGQPADKDLETKLGTLPAGMDPDSVDFSASELYVLDKGKISVFSLPDISFKRSFCGSGRDRGQLWPRHNWDQTVRLASGTVLAEDNNKLIIFSPDGKLIDEKRKPAESIWFVPIGDRFVAKNMVVSGDPPLQYIRIVLYDGQLKEIKELYRQIWFQQQEPPGFTTELPGDLLHFTVVQDKICIEESPGGFRIEIFDSAGQRLSLIEKPASKVAMTNVDREREMAKVHGEKRVAAMIDRAGSWEKLRQIWRITFPPFKPVIREVQALQDGLLVRTSELHGGNVKYLWLDLQGNIRRELFLPLGTDAETEARVCGTSFFKMIDDRFLFLRRDPVKDLWEVHQARIRPIERP